MIIALKDIRNHQGFWRLYKLEDHGSEKKANIFRIYWEILKIKKKKNGRSECAMIGSKSFYLILWVPNCVMDVRACSAAIVSSVAELKIKKW